MGDHVSAPGELNEGSALVPNPDPSDEEAFPLVSWLDAGTARYLRCVVALIARTAPDALAAILFGSVARREARPLTDPDPSDVDLLVLFTPPDEAPATHANVASAGGDPATCWAPQNGSNGAEELTARQHQVLSEAVVRALEASPDAAHDVNVVGALTHFARWDPQFIEHIARDGILLWARGPLPPALAAVEARECLATTPLS